MSREGGCYVLGFFVRAPPLGARVDTDVVEEAYLNCRKHNGGNYVVPQTRPMSCVFLASTVVFADDTDLKIWHRGLTVAIKIATVALTCVL